MNLKYCAVDECGESKTCCFKLKEKTYNSLVYYYSYNFDVGVHLLVKEYGTTTPFPIENTPIRERITNRDVRRVQDYCWVCEEQKFTLSDLARPTAKTIKEKIIRWFED